MGQCFGLDGIKSRESEKHQLVGAIGESSPSNCREHGLYFGEDHPLAADMLGADAAALTHGHEMGYIPAAMLVHIIPLGFP